MPPEYRRILTASFITFISSSPIILHHPNDPNDILQPLVAGQVFPFHQFPTNYQELDFGCAFIDPG
jgi:hypothetical protein